jgi:iron(III) transport system substrate-binding protein
MMSCLRSPWIVATLLVAVLLMGSLVWLGQTPATAADSGLVLYSGRSKALVQPIVRQFTRETGIPVEVRYGATAQLAVALMEEGARSPADVFWAQDAGALGAAVKAGLLAELPSSLLERVPETYRNPQAKWVATSGRARTLAYSAARVDATNLPASVFDLTDPRFRNRIGWSPTNASFQAFVTAMRRTEGDERTRQWLIDMRANGARAYNNNTAILQAIAAGEVDLGLTNHYYLLKFKATDPNYPVEQTAFAASDIGNMLNVAGVGVLASSQRKDRALRLVDYLLSTKAQQYFASETFEYPVTDDVIASEHLGDPQQAVGGAPTVDLDSLEDLEGTLTMLREVGLL